MGEGVIQSPVRLHSTISESNIFYWKRIRFCYWPCLWLDGSKKIFWNAYNKDAARSKSTVTKRSFAFVLNDQTGASSISTTTSGNTTKKKCILCCIYITWPFTCCGWLLQYAKRRIDVTVAETIRINIYADDSQYFPERMEDRLRWNSTHHNIVYSDIAITKVDSLPRNSWYMARITNTQLDNKCFVRSCLVDSLLLLIPVERTTR